MLILITLNDHLLDLNDVNYDVFLIQVISCVFSMVHGACQVSDRPALLAWARLGKGGPARRQGWRYH